MARRDFSPRLYDAPPTYFPVVLIASILVEGLRFYFHPETYHLVRNPRTFAVFCMCANVAFHLWNRPGNNGKAAVSALLAETSMPTLLLILTAFLTDAALLVARLFSQLTAPAIPH